MKAKFLMIGFCLMIVGIMIPSATVSAQEETTVYIEQIKGEDLQELQEYMVSNIINTMATRYNVNWTVPANTRYKSGAFTLNSNIGVYMAMELSNSAQVGIIGYDGTKKYVVGSSIYTTITTWSRQNYCFFVQNNNSSSITASGYYYR